MSNFTKNRQVYTATLCLYCDAITQCDDDLSKWKHFPCHWPFVRGIHRSPVNCPHKGQWRGALLFSLICDWINGWVDSCEAGDPRRHRAHYDVIVMCGIYHKSLPRFVIPWTTTVVWLPHCHWQNREWLHNLTTKAQRGVNHVYGS